MPGLFRHPPQPQQRIRRVRPGTALYPVFVASDINPGAEQEELASFTPGGGTIHQGRFTTVLGPTAGIQYKDVISTLALTWFTNPLRAVTIVGPVTMHLWMGEQFAADNVGAQCKVEWYDNTGTTLKGTLFNSEEGVQELSDLTQSEIVWAVTPTSSALVVGDRLKITVYGNDAAGFTMAAGGITVFNYNGPAESGNGKGGSYLLFTEELVEQVAQVLIRSWSEAVATADAWTRGFTGLRSLTESITTSDAWIRTGTFLRTWAEAISSSDAWTRTATLARALTQTLTTSDAWTRAVTLARTWSESVSTSDAWVRVVSFVRTMAEAIATSDAWTRAVTLARALTESITTSDTWTRTATLFRSWSEAISTSDAWVASKLIIRSWSEAVSTADVWTRTGTFLRTMTEAVSTGDVWVRVGTFARSWSSSVTSSDAWTRTATLLRSWSEAIVTSDVWTRTATLVRTLTEAIATADSWVRVIIGGGVSFVTGLPPVAFAIHYIARALGRHDVPAGSAAGPVPSGEGAHDVPEAEADHPTPEGNT